MTAEDRPATRFDPRDADPLMHFELPCLEEFREEPSDRYAYLCVLTVGHVGEHFAGITPTERDGIAAKWAALGGKPERSGAVFLYLAVILAIVAGTAIALLWWTFE